VKETEEIVIEKPISTGFYGYPKNLYLPALMDVVNETVDASP